MKITLVAVPVRILWKIAPIIRAIHSSNKAGDKMISSVFAYRSALWWEVEPCVFKELELPEPDVNLGAGSGTQAEQTARIMIEFEKGLKSQPNWSCCSGGWCYIYFSLHHCGQEDEYKGTTWWRANSFLWHDHAGRNQSYGDRCSGGIISLPQQPSRTKT